MLYLSSVADHPLTTSRLQLPSAKGKPSAPPTTRRAEAAVAVVAPARAAAMLGNSPAGP